MTNKSRIDCGHCYECLKDKTTPEGWPLVVTMMVLCEHCGYKRCPHSTDHELPCTNSNESGQPGSRYQ